MESDVDVGVEVTVGDLRPAPPLLLLIVKALALEDANANSAVVMRGFFSIMIIAFHYTFQNVID